MLADRRLLAALCLAAVALPAAARIPRDAGAVRAFRAVNPCPATGLTRGKCPGWQVDHIKPLCAGGADHPHNMQWIDLADHRFKTFLDVRGCRATTRQ